MPASIGLLTTESPHQAFRRLGAMLAISLAVHLATFLLVALLQWTPIPRPMTSHEVTIVSLQEPRVRFPTPVTQPTPAPVPPQAQREPVMPPAPPRTAEAASPPPASKVQPAAEPLPTRPRTMRELLGQDMPVPPPTSKVEPSKPDDSVRHLMREVQLPPEAPRLGEQIPAAGAPVKSAKAMESSVKNLVVPTASKPAVQPAAEPLPTRPRTMRELLGQDMPAPPPTSKVEPPKPDDAVRRLMQEVQLPPEAPRLGEQIPAAGAPVKSAKAMESSVKNLVVPTASKPAVRPQTTPDLPISAVPATPQPIPAPSFKSLVTQELQKPMASPAAPPVVAATPPTADLQKPTLAIRSQSAAPGQSRYLAIVQQRISQNWAPPAVEMSSRSLQVLVKFRLASSGQVTNVTVEQSSGESYYDLAGRRAVLSAVPLPPFPSDLREPWLDVHVSFTVGEGAG